MAVNQKVKVRSGVKPAVDLDLDQIAQKRGTLAQVLAQICHEHLQGDPIAKDLTSQRVDVEIRSGRPGEVAREEALRLSDDWQTKVLPVLAARENIEIGLAHHVTGGTARAASTRPLTASLNGVEGPTRARRSTGR